MEAKKHGRCVCRDEIVQEVYEWMVVVSRERKWSLQCMIPGLVVLGREMILRMEDIAVDDVYQYLLLMVSNPSSDARSSIQKNQYASHTPPSLMLREPSP